MGTLGWVILAIAFLLFFMVANNSWPFVWNKIQRGIPKEGEGNRIVPNPPESDTPGELIIPPDMFQGPPPGTIVPTPNGT